MMFQNWKHWTSTVLLSIYNSSTVLHTAPCAARIPLFYVGVGLMSVQLKVNLILLFSCICSGTYLNSYSPKSLTCHGLFLILLSQLKANKYIPMTPFYWTKRWERYNEAEYGRTLALPVSHTRLLGQHERVRRGINWFLEAIFKYLWFQNKQNIGRHTCIICFDKFHPDSVFVSI